MSEDEVGSGHEPRLLPVAKLEEKEFLVDVKNRLFRNFTNPDEVISMHSVQGRKMVKDMQGSEWRSYGVSTGRTGAVRTAFEAFSEMEIPYLWISI